MEIFAGLALLTLFGFVCTYVSETFKTLKNKDLKNGR